MVMAVPPEWALSAATFSEAIDRGPAFAKSLAGESVKLVAAVL
jgi:hypothetical protein